MFLWRSGQIIVTESGGEVFTYPLPGPLQYNKETLIHPPYVASARPSTQELFNKSEQFPAIFTSMDCDITISRIIESACAAREKILQGVRVMFQVLDNIANVLLLRNTKARWENLFIILLYESVISTDALSIGFVSYLRGSCFILTASTDCVTRLCACTVAYNTLIF